MTHAAGTCFADAGMPSNRFIYVDEVESDVIDPADNERRLMQM